MLALDVNNRTSLLDEEPVPQQSYWRRAASAVGILGLAAVLSLALTSAARTPSLVTPAGDSFFQLQFTAARPAPRSAEAVRAVSKSQLATADARHANQGSAAVSWYEALSEQGGAPCVDPSGSPAGCTPGALGRGVIKPEAAPRGKCPPLAPRVFNAGGQEFAFGMPEDSESDGPVVIFLPGTGSDCDKEHRTEFFTTVSSHLPTLCVAYDTTAAFTEEAVAVSITDEIERQIGNGVAALIESHPGCSLLASLNVRGDDASGWDWGRLILSGHSQGGVHAARISQRHRVGRAVFLSSPCAMFSDAIPWMSDPFATPPERLFGLTSVADETCPWEKRGWNLLFNVNQIGVRRQWARIGITDLLEVSDRTSPAYTLGSSHGVYLTMKRSAVGCGLYVNGHTETIHDLIRPCWYDRKRTWGLLYGWV